LIQRNNYSALAAAELRRTRRAIAGESPQAFAQVYLTADCPLKFSRMHTELFELLQNIIDKRAGRLAIAAPRGHAKSTIVSLAFVLWCVLYEKEKLVLIVSATQDQAILLLKAIKDQIRSNEQLIEDFPDVCKRRLTPWRDKRIQLGNGAMILAYGASQGLRGAKNKSHRPGLIVVDDIENSEHVVSEDQRHKLGEWFRGTLLHAGHSGTNVVVVGTVLHYDSLLANLINPKDRRGWEGRKYQAIENFGDHPDLWEKWAGIFRCKIDHEDEMGPEAANAFYGSNKTEMLQGTKVLWPEREDYRALMVIREREGLHSFQAEKQNEPIDSEQCIFAENNFHYWDDEHADENALRAAHGKNGGVFYAACDPSLGRRTGQGDYTGIVILYQSRKPRINYVVVADLARRSPDKTLEKIIQFTAMYPISRFAIETNQFQSLMLVDIVRRAKKAGVRTSFVPIESRTHKESRIASLEPEVTQGRIRFSRRHHLLLDQLRQFPHAAHDDGPDALEMAIQVGRGPDLSQCSNAIGTYVPRW
jgi:predicted phage terminase large subunit-like protein